MHQPDLSHITDLRTRASAHLATMQVEAAQKILMANGEMFGPVAMNPAIAIALAQVIALNHASPNLVFAGDEPAAQ
jgi:hypothetical protein